MLYNLAEGEKASVIDRVREEEERKEGENKEVSSRETRKKPCLTSLHQHTK